MNHDVLSFFKHIFVRKNIIFDDLTIILRNKIDKFLAACMIKGIRHFIGINPIFTKLLPFFFDFCSNVFGFNFFENYIILNNLFVFEENTLNLMERMLIDFELFRNIRLLLDLIDIFLDNKFHRFFSFLFLFFLLKFLCMIFIFRYLSLPISALRSLLIS